jgi:hypothetical protein
LTDPNASRPRAWHAEKGVRPLLVGTFGLLLTGGVLLDVNRINGVRDVLDRVARTAAIEAVAASRPLERQHVCEKRFKRSVWTTTEVNIEDLEVSVHDQTAMRTSTVIYDASVNLVVGRFFGMPEVTISGQAQANAPIDGNMLSLP